MGHYPRRKPRRLARKLVEIRHYLELSQDGMLSRLGLEERFRSSVSGFERGGEPELHILLRYARLADIPVEVLIDDDLDLPAALRAKAKRQAAVAKSQRTKRRG